MIDICLYYDHPCELHDIGVVMCTLGLNGIETLDPCREALDIGISHIYPESAIHPTRSAERMLKYNARLGTKYYTKEVLTFCAMYKIQEDLVIKLMNVSC